MSGEGSKVRWLPGGLARVDAWSAIFDLPGRGARGTGELPAGSVVLVVLPVRGELDEALVVGPAGALGWALARDLGAAP